MQRRWPRFRSQQFFLCKICFFPQIYRDLHGDAMLVPVRMRTNMAAETNRNIFHRVLLQKRSFISGGTQNNKIILFPIQELFR